MKPPRHVLESKRLNSLANLKPAKPGEIRNPIGRAPGTRDYINKRYLKALAEDFDKHGVKALQDAREKDPMGYIRAIGALQPKEFIIERPLEAMSDEELKSMAEHLRTELLAARGRAGDVYTQGPTAAIELRPVP